jgi:hypothetical protein
MLSKSNANKKSLEILYPPASEASRGIYQKWA